MIEFKVIVRVDIVSKDGNMIINKACDGVEKSFLTFYGVRVRAQRSMSRIYRRDVRNLSSFAKYASNNLFYGDGIVDQNHTLVRVSLSMASREANYWKLKNMEQYLDTISGKYNQKVFCNVGQ